MNHFLIAIAIGVVAGIIDALPMIIQKLDKRDTLNAFLHYLVLGLIIPYVQWDLVPWIKGIIISTLSATPVIIGVFPRDKKAVIPIFIFSIILGAGIGIAGAVLIG